MAETPLLTFSPKGLYCEQADVYIDPWRGVNRAIITHAHSDHARMGSQHYLAHPVTRHLMHARLSPVLPIEEMAVGASRLINGVRFSFHPAGHIPGSVQVRVERGGETWVVSGDYKRQADGISEPFEPVRCHTFITECTFGLPVYRWRAASAVFDEINAWWWGNAAQGICSVISAYSLGKAQRVIAGVDGSIGPVLVHGAVANMNGTLEACGIVLPPWQAVTRDTPKEQFRRALVVAPGSALGTPWANRMRPFSTAMASGWMQLRGRRRWANLDKGFVLSDHADWDALLATIAETGAEHVVATHGYSDLFSQYLRATGLSASAGETPFFGQPRDSEAGNSDQTPEDN